MKKQHETKMSRRAMMAVSAGALTPLVLPSGVVGAYGYPGANDQPRVGLIGCGRRGAEILAHLGRRVAAICDVDERRLDAASAIVGEAKRHDDYRRILDDRDIDGVVIATPDHWHAIQACRAIEAGKDVYLETPVCLNLGDAALLLSTARRFAAVVYTGKAAQWSRGEAEPLDTNEQFPDRGTIQVSCWGDDNERGGDPALNGPAPDGLDWERWLGPARWRPYNPALLGGNARFVLGLGGGELASQGSHVFYAVLDALALQSLGVVSVSVRGTPPLDGLYDAPQVMRVEYDLPAHKLAMVWQQRKLADANKRFGARLRRDGHITPLTPVLSDTGTDPQSRALADSLRYWLDAIVLRTDTTPDLLRATSSAALAALGNVAYRVGRSVTWDSEAGRFHDDPIADRLIAPPVRHV